MINGVQCTKGTTEWESVVTFVFRYTSRYLMLTQGTPCEHDLSVKHAWATGAPMRLLGVHACDPPPMIYEGLC